MTVSIVVLAVLLGLIPAAIAQRKGYDFVGFWLFGALMFIVALPVVLLMPANLTGKRKCPHCTEYVPVEAKVCKVCHRDLPSPPAAGWYANPEGNGERYWDGLAWTQQVRELDEVRDVPDGS